MPASISIRTGRIPAYQRALDHFPILGLGNEASPHGVGVDVVDRSTQSGGRRDIAVIATAGLPKTMPEAAALAHPQPL